MTAAIIEAMLISVLLTIDIELIAAAIMGVRKRRTFIITILVNTLTNPFVTCAYYYCAYEIALSGIMLTAIKYALEIGAVCTEWQIYKRTTDVNKPFMMSLVCNCASYFLGVVFNMIV